ncbi:RNA polymerase sigma factor [Staphylococcus edaphicus]|uniref:RNA polymerase sigma factor n=1 Tax=Staphylococcus edaphicus TaxID=1955013 RepID=A0A2C6WPR8_9STAP|nr:RNA polymerase sigma factor [Staphylococcus edaphicus]PHK49457.1 RNA polymerase subunit sigma [Staphylococcus edaphicus]UQW81280.1 RNA polymerase sigma factor [Staphylococcus edaphicus]
MTKHHLNQNVTSTKHTAIRQSINIPDIFNVLTPMIRKRLYHFSIHPNDQADLCQEVLIKLYYAFKKFDFTDATPIEHYVNRVIKNVKNDYIRKKLYGYERQSMLINEFIVDYEYSKTNYPLDKYILSLEAGTQLQQGIMKLTTLEQSIMSYLLNDYKPKEIAGILNIRIKVVYNAIHRCKMKLRRFLENEE